MILKIIFPFILCLSTVAQTVMPNNKPLVCCDDTEADVVDVPTIGKKIFYCRAFRSGKFVKHGNYHTFEKGMLSEEKVYFNDEVQRGRRPTDTCSDGQGQAAARSGKKLRGRPMGKPDYGRRAKLKERTKGLVKLGQNAPSGIANNGLLNKVLERQKTINAKNLSDTSMADGGKIGDCPDEDLRKRIKEQADQIPPSRVVCDLKNKTGLAFIEKVKVIERKQMELGSQDYPCFKEMFYSRYKVMMWDWERVRLSYCGAERSPDAKFQNVPKKILESQIKTQPYWVSNFTYPQDLKDIQLYGTSKVPLGAIGFKIPQEMENAFKPALFLTIKKLKNDPEVKALHQKMLNTID